MTAPHPPASGRDDQDERPLLPALLVHGWACGTCGGGGVASDGSTCADCDGHGHTC
jgi:DnaJ-class molecular chaperone